MPYMSNVISLLEDIVCNWTLENGDRIQCDIDG